MSFTQTTILFEGYNQPITNMIQPTGSAEKSSSETFTKKNNLLSISVIS